MKKKIVMALMVGCMMGTMMTGCGSKANTPETTETIESTETDSNESESTDVDESSETEKDTETKDTMNTENVTETDSTDETTDENSEVTEGTVDSDMAIDESTILDSEIPDDPAEAVAIIKAIKNADVRYDYFAKANDKYLDEEVSDTWSSLIDPYLEAIISGTEID